MIDKRISVDRREIILMFECDYVVVKIDGDYAYLQQLDDSNAEEKLVARALLPEEIKEGSKLHYAMLQYTLI